jgi:ribonuclease BN (tRNA processing enzyme)
MKLKVIGYWGAYPEAESATSCYLVEKDDFKLLVDCGSGALSRLQKYISLSELNAVIISHYHHDHVADIGPLQYAIYVQSFLKEGVKKLPIYGHQDDMEGFRKLSYHSTEAKAYDPKEKLKVGPLEISFLKTIHPADCYAMRITDGKTSIVYTADTVYFDELIPFSRNADLLVAESSFYKGMDSSGGGHMTSEQCARLAKEANVKELWLTHLPHFGDIAKLKDEAQEIYSGEVKLVHEGLTFQK